MLKRFLSIILVAVLFCTMIPHLPITVLADEISVQGEYISYDNIKTRRVKLEDASVLRNGFSYFVEQKGYQTFVDELMDSEAITVYFAYEDITNDGIEELIVDAMNRWGWYTDIIFSCDSSGTIDFLGAVFSYESIRYSSENRLLYVYTNDYTYASCRISNDGLEDIQFDSSNETYVYLDWMMEDELMSILDDSIPDDQSKDQSLEYDPSETDDSAHDNSAELNTKKRLVKIIQIMTDDGYTSEYTFTYNEWNLPASIHQSYSSDYERTVEYTYDNEGRFIRYGDSEENVYTYDSNGRLTKYVERVGDMVATYTYFYDAEGKRERAVCNRWGVAETTKYFYDKNGRLEQMQNDSGSEYYTYDSMGLLQKAQSEYATTTYAYNTDGQLESTYTEYNHPTMVITHRMDYDYESNAPFFVAHGEGTSSELWIEDTAGHTIWSLSYTRSTAYTGDLIFETDQNGLVVSAEDDVWTWEFVYETLQVETEDITDSTEDDTIDGYSHTEWVEQHIKYASSDLYQMQITPQFRGELGVALEDIVEDDGIKAYRTLDAVNNILSFDIEKLNETQEYELLLAQILFTRTGVSSLEEAYEKYLPQWYIASIEFLLKNADFAKNLDDNADELKQMVEVLRNCESDSEMFAETLENIMHRLKNYKIDFPTEFLKSAKGAGIDFVAGFLSGEIEVITGTLDEFVMYISAANAYRETSDAFGELLLDMRQQINVPSDDPRFAPIPGLSTFYSTFYQDSMLQRIMDSDPLSEPVNYYELAKAIENFYLTIEESKETDANIIAQKALVNLTEGTLDNLVDTQADVVLSLFSCLPVVREFEAIRKLFNGAMFVIDTFTGFDDRAYLGTMVIRLYCISNLHYHTVNALSGNAIVQSYDWDWASDNGDSEAYSVRDAWNTVPINYGKSLEEYQFERAVLFDEAVNVYKSIHCVAVQYATAYYRTYLIRKPDGSIRHTSDSVHAIKLQEYLWGISAIQCHTSSIMQQIPNESQFEWTGQKVYTLTCPVEMIVKNEKGQIIATLTGLKNTIEPGYEQHFMTMETEYGSGDYIKIAIVPSDFTMMLRGISDGMMNLYTGNYSEEGVVSTEAFLDIPVHENDKGYLSESSDESSILELTMGEESYKSKVITPDKQEDTTKVCSHMIWVAICLLGVILVVIVFTLKRN